MLYLVEDNGYAISTPVRCRRPAATSRASSNTSPGSRSIRCDGTDYIASYDTMREAVAHVRARKGPALVHAKVVRPYSHSLSDDEKLYKTKEEREAEARRDPLLRMRELLLSEELATRRGAGEAPGRGRTGSQCGRAAGAGRSKA